MFHPVIVLVFTTLAWQSAGGPTEEVTPEKNPFDDNPDLKNVDQRLKDMTTQLASASAEMSSLYDTLTKQMDTYKGVLNRMVGNSKTLMTNMKMMLNEESEAMKLKNQDRMKAISELDEVISSAAKASPSEESPSEDLPPNMPSAKTISMEAASDPGPRRSEMGTAGSERDVRSTVSEPDLRGSTAGLERDDVRRTASETHSTPELTGGKAGAEKGMSETVSESEQDLGGGGNAVDTASDLGPNLSAGKAGRERDTRSL